MMALRNKMKSFDPAPSWLPVALVLGLASLARVIPHAANVTPFFAVAMAAGAWMGRDHLKTAAGLVVASMLLSDLILGFHWTMPFVYAGLALGAVIAAFANEQLVKSGRFSRQALGAFLTAGVGSAVFFVMSNVGVWLVGEIYPRTADGLIACFVMAIPFFQKSLVSDLFFGTVLLTGVAQLAARRSSMARTQVEGGTLNA